MLGFELSLIGDGATVEAGIDDLEFVLYVTYSDLDRTPYGSLLLEAFPQL